MMNIYDMDIVQKRDKFKYIVRSTNHSWKIIWHYLIGKTHGIQSNILHLNVYNNIIRRSSIKIQPRCAFYY